MECIHTMTQGRKGERGSWCMACGVKVYDVDERQCQDCAHSRKLFDGTICKKHLMGVPPSMNVTFKIVDGSCWTAKTGLSPAITAVELGALPGEWMPGLSCRAKA